MGFRRWSLLASGVVVLATAGATAAPADAQRLDPLGTLQQLLIGTAGDATRAVQPVLCPTNVTTPVAIANLTCNLDLLHHRYVTKFKRPDGTIFTRTYGAMIAVPTLLDVNGDGTSDVVATATIASASSVRLTIDKVAGAPAMLPASVEAIIADPTKGSLPRSTIAYGEDALESTLPQRFTSNVAFAKEGGDVRIDVDDTVSGAGPSLKVLAGLFDGTPEQRRNEVGGSMRYTPVPATFGAHVTIGGKFTGRLTTGTPAKLDLGFRNDDGLSVQRFDGTIDKLPGTTEVAFEQAGPDQRKVSFVASAPIDAIDGVYERGSTLGGSTATERNEAHITEMPTKLLVEQTGPKQATLSTLGTGPIGQVRVGLANGTPRFLQTDEAYVHTFDDASVQSMAAQINGLTSATFDGQGAIELDAAFSTPDENPLRVVTEDPVRNLAVRVDDVPDHITATVDLDGGRITYDGHGQTVHAIDVDAAQTTPFFTRATRLDGAIRDLPPKVELHFKPGARAANFTTDEPIGLVDLLASDGATSGIPGDDAGARYVDRPDQYLVHGRIEGLKTVTFSGGDTYAANIEMEPGDFSLFYDDAEHLLDGTVKGLPGTLTATIDPAAGHGEYHASEPIPEIDVDYRTATPFEGRIRSASVRLLQVPKDIVVTTATADGKGVKVKTVPGVGTIEAALSSKETTPTVPGDDSGAIATFTPDELSGAVRIKKINEVTITADPLTVDVKADEQQRFTIEGTFNDPNDVFPGNSTVKGFIEKIPSSVFVAVQDKFVDYVAAEPIDRIFLDADRLPDTIQEVKVDIRGVPKELDIYAGQDKKFGVDALGAKIDEINVNIADFQRYGDLTGSNNAVALDTYESTPDPDGITNFRAHIHDLRKAVLSELIDGAKVVDFGLATARRIDADLRAGEGFKPVQTNIGIPSPPLETKVTLYSAFHTAVILDSSAPIPLVNADVRIGPDGFSAQADNGETIFTSTLRNVPTHASFCLADENPRCIGAFPVMSPHPYSFSSAATLQLDFQSNGPPVSDPNAMRIDARLCMGPLAGDPAGESFTHYNPDGCRKDVHAYKYLDLRNLRMRDLHLEVAEGGQMDSHYGDDAHVGVFMDTDGLQQEHAGSGFLVDRLRYVDPSIPTRVDGVQLRQPSEEIVFDRWWFVLDTTDTGPDIPSIRSGPHGTFTCPDSTVVNLLHREQDGNILLVGVDFPGSDPIFDFSGPVGC